MAGQARAALAALDDRQAKLGEIRDAAAVVLLAEQDPAAARRELRVVLDGDVPVLSYLTQVEAHLHIARGAGHRHPRRHPQRGTGGAEPAGHDAGGGTQPK